MHDIEFVKLRMWMNAQLATVRELLFLVLFVTVHTEWVRVIILTCIVFNIIASFMSMTWVEKHHKGYGNIPKW